MDISTLLIISAAIALGFFVQSVTGFAAGIVALPLLLFVLPLQPSVALLAIYMLLFGIILIVKYWRDVDKKIVGYMTIGVIPGLIIGVYLLANIDTEILKKILGAFILIHVVSHWLRGNKNLLPKFRQTGFAAGFVGGIFSGLYSGGSPIYAIYIVRALKEARAIRATIAAMLLVANFLRVPLLVGCGILTFETVKTALIAAPVFLLALYFGNKVHRKLDNTMFKQVVMALLALCAIMLLIK